VSITTTKREPLGRAFNQLWSATLASHVADGLLKTAVPLLAASLTRDPVVISLLGALAMLPWLLFAIPIGTMVDRVDRKKAMAWSNIVRLAGAAALTLSIASQTVSIPLLYLLVFLIGAAEVLYDTTAQALVPAMLKPELLERANSRLQIGATTVGEMVASPMSGVLYALAIGIPFVSGTAAIGLALVLVLLIPGSYRKVMNLDVSAAPTSALADMKFGIKYLYEDKNLLRLVLYTTTVGFFFSSTGSTMVLFLLHDLHVPVSIFGFVMLASAVGNILGGIFAPRLSKRFGRMNTMAAGIVLSGVTITIGGLAPNIWVWSVLAVIGGVCMAQWNILLMSTYHQIIPNELFGRIHGTRRTLVWGLMPFGNLLGGVLATIDLRAPMLIGGGLAAFVALLGVPFVRSLSKLVD
jgi:MFS family permease